MAAAMLARRKVRVHIVDARTEASREYLQKSGRTRPV